MPRLAPDNVDALQDLHDLEKELDRNAPAFRNVLDPHRGFTLEIQRQFQHGGAGIFVSG